MRDDSDDLKFDLLYRTHADAIRGYCIRRLGPDDGADAAADVFVVVWRRLDDCPVGDEARLWIYGVARNIVANRRRATARSISLLHRASRVAVPADPGPEPIVIQRSEYQALGEALAQLPDRYREPLVLAEWDGLDRETIARLEGVSRSAIDQRISRAYKKLAQLMNRKAPKEKLFTVPRPIEEGGDT